MQRGYIEILVTYKFSMYHLSIALDMETSTANKFSQK